MMLSPTRLFTLSASLLVILGTSACQQGMRAAPGSAAGVTAEERAPVDAFSANADGGSRGGVVSAATDTDGFVECDKDPTLPQCVKHEHTEEPEVAETCDKTHFVRLSWSKDCRDFLELKTGIPYEEFLAQIKTAMTNHTSDLLSTLTRREDVCADALPQESFSDLPDGYSILYFKNSSVELPVPSKQSLFTAQAFFSADDILQFLDQSEAVGFRFVAPVIRLPGKKTAAPHNVLYQGLQPIDENPAITQPPASEPNAIKFQ